MRTRGYFGCYATPVYHDLPPRPEVAPPHGGRVFLVAIRGERSTALGPNGLDRVHVMVIDPNDLTDFSDPLSVVCALPEVATTPPPYETPPHALVPVRSRPVTGEILRDHEGKLYERRGRQLIPLRTLISGRQGEILEYGHPTPERRYEVQATIDPVPNPDEAISAEFEDDGGRTIDVKESAALQKLFADPGQLRLVPLADFPQQLTPQLARPERVRESHRLACYVQVFTLTESMSLERFAHEIGEQGPFPRLVFVNDVIAVKLGLPDTTRERIRQRARNPRRPGLLLPGDMVARIQLVRDPTAETVQPERDLGRAAERSVPEPPAPAGKKSIPERYSKPWEFRLSREEALYDMQAAAGVNGWFRRLARFLHAWRNRDELRRWRALVVGKSPDDQLWAIRPPQWALRHPVIREWAASTLAVAGYDSQSMLPEWEIYWRRKGL